VVPATATAYPAYFALFAAKASIPLVPYGKLGFYVDSAALSSGCPMNKRDSTFSQTMNLAETTLTLQSGRLYCASVDDPILEFRFANARIVEAPVFAHAHEVCLSWRYPEHVS
jgi:hypothetical protein